MVRYSSDVLGSAASPAGRPKAVPVVAADRDLVVETADGSFCGAVSRIFRDVVAGERRDVVALVDRFGKERVFPMLPAAFAIDGALVTLARPAPVEVQTRPGRTASGSVAVADVRAQVAKASRIWVEGVHDAALVDRIWGDDLRIEGIVVEPLGGIDNLAADVRAFGPSPSRRLGVLVDHLVAGSKETRIVGSVKDENVLVTGHPYVDIWQAVTPAALGIQAWPVVSRSMPWKEGIAAALGFSDPREVWRRVLGSVSGYTDVEVPLLKAVEELIDFVTVGHSG